MAALKFASSHNMVAFLDKPTKSDGFEQIVDFLNAHPIKYALTVNPTIYTTCIEKFWDTAKVKTINGEVQIQALVDKKKVIITETSVRSDLQLEDAKGTECLPNATIFEQLTLMGYENLTKKLTFYKAFFSPQWKFLIHKVLQCLSAKTTAWNEFSNNMASAGKDFSSRDTPLFPTMIVQAQEQVGEEPVTNDTKNVESVPTHPNDPLLSGEDRLKLNELMVLCTSLSQRVLDLEKIKTSQAAEITELKERVKKLENKGGSRTHRLRRLYKVGRSTRVVSSKDEGLGDQEDASKQRRKIDEIDQDAEVTLVDETQGRYDDNLMFDTGVLDNEQDMAEKEVDMAEKDVSTADLVTIVGEVVTTANVVVSTDEVTTNSTITTIVDELTLAQTLIEIKAAKPKARGVIVQEPSEFTTTTSPSQPLQLPRDKDKGKAKMVEPEKPLKKKDHIMFDKEEDHFARLRAEEQRRKPPTKAKKRNTMSTYLENMDGYKHNQLKNKSFEDIQMLFDKQMKRVNIFVDMDTELVKDENVKAKVDDDQEEAEMKKHMEIIPDDEVAIDAIPLVTKPPIIVNWKIIKEGKMG
ncbi:hypothetical protein Tco_0168626 [Tanacetum coccineum]